MEILTLTRYGNTGTATYGLVDSLSMKYSGNQLFKVEDIAADPTLSTSMDFRNGVNVAQEYFYDPNGNLKKDLNTLLSGKTIISSHISSGRL